MVKKLFSKNSNLCDHNPLTSQTDGQTTCDRKTALCTKVHRAVTRDRLEGESTQIAATNPYSGRERERERESGDTFCRQCLESQLYVHSHRQSSCVRSYRACRRLVPSSATRVTGNSKRRAVTGRPSGSCCCGLWDGSIGTDAGGMQTVCGRTSHPASRAMT